LVSGGIDFCKYIPRRLSACSSLPSHLFEEIAIFRKNICTPSTQNKTLRIRVNIDYLAPIGFVS
jgi:hypothetical protein